MIKKIFATGIVCLAFAYSLFAQDNRSDTSRHAKKCMHVVGVQANALFRQIFNFGNANNPVNNPYLLTYTCISRKSKWGADAGVGYTLNQFFENDGNTKKENFINDLYLRLGIQKLLPLNRRFTSSFNVHLLFDLLNSKTRTESNFGSQVSVVNSNSSSIRYGLGPCLGLRYKISNRVFIGTECSYYFKMGNNKSKVSTYTVFNGQQEEFEETNSDKDLFQFIFNVPTAIYLSIRL